MEKYWEQYVKNIGDILEGQKVLIKFKYIGEKPVVKIKPGCKGCTKIKEWDNNILTVEFKANKIPVHITGDNQAFNKFIIVEYEDGFKEPLKFYGVINRK